MQDYVLAENVEFKLGNICGHFPTFKFSRIELIRFIALIWTKQDLGWEFQEDEENVNANNIQASFMIKMGKSPWLVAVNPNSDTIYVTRFFSDIVYTIILCQFGLH